MYKTINNRGWADILYQNHVGPQPPISVHVPIQPVHSPDFVHVDRALNAVRRTVAQNADGQNHEAVLGLRKMECLIVHFAWDTLCEIEYLPGNLPEIS